MTDQPRLPLTKPTIPFGDVEADIRTILESGQLTSGRFVSDFEASVASFVGVDHAVAVTSATTALHLALVCAGVKPGDDVLVSDFTFPATANVVLQQGATPVLVDSLPDGFELSVEDLEARLTPATTAIIAVDPFGQPADHRRLENIADAHNLTLIADAACSLGAIRDNRQAGAHGDVGCFSFHPRKTITCGEGGMLTTNNEELAAKARTLRSHGAERTPTGIVFNEAGYNYRLSEIQAALGLSQMRRIDEILDDRRQTAHTFEDLLADTDGVTVPQAPADTNWAYQSFVVVLDDYLSRADVVAHMAAENIETTIGTYACHQHGAYTSFTGSRALPNSARFGNQALTLPLLPSMTRAQIDRTVTALHAAIDSALQQATQHKAA